MDVRTYIRASLRDIYPSREIESFIRLIMERVCGLAPYQLLLGKDTQISDSKEQEIRKIVDRLHREEPLQYILGEETFYDMDFEVNPSVLIPRPETAEMVDLIIREETSEEKVPLRILDIGTGSGCIAIAIARHLPQAEVHALDVSAEALATARRNAEKNNVQVSFHLKDILSMDKEPHLAPDFQILVSNPPYIRELEKKEMDRNVLDYEPAGALFVPDDDPLLFYRTIARLGKHWLSRDGKLYFEINSGLGKECVELLQQEGYKAIELHQDFYNKDRIIKAQKD